MTAQTSYAINIAIAYAGQLFDIGEQDIISRDAEGVAGIDFGLAVSRGTDPDTQCVIGGSATNFLGISIRSLEREGAANTGAIKYNETETVGILRKGRVSAVCPTGCVPNDPVNFVNATGVLDSGAAVAGETLVNNAYWASTTGAGEIGVIQIDSPIGLTAGS